MAFADALSPLRHRNYRLYFFGQSVSLIGSWMAYMAQGWLVTVLAHGNEAVASTYLSILYGASTIPFLFGGLITGSFADRSSPKNILIVAVSFQLVINLLLAFLVYTNQVELWHVIVLTLLLGVTSVFETPAFAALYPTLLPDSEFAQSSALDSNINQLARLLGPAIGGIFARFFVGSQEMMGVAQCIFWNAISYIPVVIAFILLKVPIKEVSQAELDAKNETGAKKPSMLAHIKEGFVLLRQNNILAAFIILNAIYPLLCAPYINLIASYIRFERKLGADAYGSILSLQGIAALVASLIGTIFIKKIAYKGRFLLFFYFLFYVLVVVTARMESFILIAVVTVVAAVVYNWGSTLRSALYQQVVPREARGRIAGISQMLFFGLVPLGSLWSAAVARTMGSGFSMLIGAILSVVAVIIIAFTIPTFFKSDKEIIGEKPTVEPK
jgi:predicted MFS family arabinose efflux permease